MRVTATQLVHWADTKDAQAGLPRLLRRLCFQAGSTRQLVLPAETSVALVLARLDSEDLQHGRRSRD